MADALTPPFALAAIVLCVAGVAKLRAPRGAAEALGVRAAAVRVFAVAELALGAWALAAPGLTAAVIVAAAYVGFAVVAMVLARRRRPCGCFGEHDRPASTMQSVVSALFAAIAALAAGSSPHGVSWLIARSPVVLVGLAAATYAAVLAYTALPVAWSAWEGGSQ